MDVGQHSDTHAATLPHRTATNSYTLTGIHRECVKVTVPFDLAIDLTEIDRL
ncbi:hypothetical protein AB0L65_41365 [Nonomuraea sp. NPDC052116]|uniref:hypothetical protein n=1 Tax=Nonomuraea sp. NPDC052116 TaxID=3155665 RepID=UPI00343F83C6